MRQADFKCRIKPGDKPLYGNEAGQTISNQSLPIVTVFNPVPSLLISNIQSGPIFPQPFLPLAKVRQYLVDFVPEGVGVVGLVEMAEFVNHDVIDDRRRGHDALPVKG